MQREYRGLITAAFISFTLSFASITHGAHATNFLNDLQAEITNRLAGADTNLTSAQLRALRAANKTLSRNTRTLGADLGLLATAATTLHTRFPNDDTFGTLETNALNAYFTEAHALRDAATNALGTNAIARGLRTQLQNALAALQKADANTNNVTSRARALATAFNRLLRPATQILQRFQAPFEAPAEILTGQIITLVETADIPQDRTRFFFKTKADNGARYLNYTSDLPEELGLWSYERLTAKTAVIHANLTFTGPDCGMPPGNSAPHDIPLTFTSATGGTFTALNCAGQTVQGTFTIETIE